MVILLFNTAISENNWAATGQNQQNYLCDQQRLRSCSLIRVFAVGLKLRSLASLRAQSEDSDQTGRMPRLIGIFSGCASHFVGFNVLWLNQNRHIFYDKHQAYMGHVMRKPVYAICELKGVDQPAHARSLIRTFVVRYLDSIPLVSTSEISRLPSFCGCTDQFESTLFINPEDRFSRDEAYMG